MAARARYFSKIDELRNNGTVVFWHDETWCNQNEEKTFVWTDRDTGIGRLRQSSGKGTISLSSKLPTIFFSTGSRLVISALMGNAGFHRSSIDIFESTEDNRMDSSHFLAWIGRTASLLRKEFGNNHLFLFLLLRFSLGIYTKIVLVIDNAPWHNRLTNDTMPPKRSWRKEHIIQWLNTHSIDVPVKAVKAELLDITMKKLPEKRYETNEAAKKYNVDILR
ncbi:unnamed protein product [Rotaria sp. Silwood1]|nr:unnamed protein product [Rotaria sp. Silwood1]